MKNINIYLIRHGESTGNIVHDQIGQSADTKLTEKGIEQATLLGNRLAKTNVVFDDIFSSSYPRAKETATIVADILMRGKEEFPILVSDELVEYDPGSWRNSKHSAIFSNIDNIKALTYRHMEFKYPNGESSHQTERRAANFLEENVIYNEDVLEEAKNQELNFLVFSHGNTIRCILHYIMGYDQSFLWRIRMDNSAINKLHYNDRGWFLDSVNDTAHLT